MAGSSFLLHMCLFSLFKKNKPTLRTKFCLIIQWDLSWIHTQTSLIDSCRCIVFSSKTVKYTPYVLTVFFIAVVIATEN